MGDSDEEDEENFVTIRVENVVSKATEATVKAFFEMTKSGGCPGAVADIRSITPGVFHVTFNEHKGETT